MISVNHQRFLHYKKETQDFSVLAFFRPPHFIPKIIYMIGNQP